MTVSRLLIATTNEGKFNEFSVLLAEHFDCVRAEKERAPDVDENGATYYENALRKAMQFHQVFGVPVLADDSGLEIDALQGRPGIHSARFGGETLSWPERWAYLHQQLAAVPTAQWSGEFRCVLCYYDGQNVPLFFEGTCWGQIVAEPKGGKGFGYDPLFFSPLLNKTLAEVSLEEKNRVTHRAQAAKNFLKWYRTR